MKFTINIKNVYLAFTANRISNDEYLKFSLLYGMLADADSLIEYQPGNKIFDELFSICKKVEGIS